MNRRNTMERHRRDGQVRHDDESRGRCRPRMRLVGVLGEAARNLATGTSHACALALAVAALIGLLAGADWLTIAMLQRQTDEYVAAGGSTWVLDYAGHVDGAACDRLVSLEGVQAAGAIRQTDSPLVFATLPSTGVPVWEGTPGSARLLALAATGTGAGADASGAVVSGTAAGGVLLSADAAKPFAVTAGDELVLKDGRTLHVAGVIDWPDDGRKSTFAYAALSPVPADAARTFDQCWVRAWPEPGNLESLIRLATDGMMPASDGSHGRPQTDRLNTTKGAAMDGAALFDSRLTAHAPWVAIAAALLLGLVLTRSRRLEMASALHCGVPKMALLTQITVETGAGALAGALMAGPLLAWVWMDGRGADAVALLDTLLRVPVAAVVGALIGASVAVAATRESRLLRYFKNR